MEAGQRHPTLLEVGKLAAGGIDVFAADGEDAVPKHAHRNIVLHLAAELAGVTAHTPFEVDGHPKFFGHQITPPAFFTSTRVSLNGMTGPWLSG